MIHEEYHNACLNMIYLASCAVRRVIPDQAKVRQMDLSVLYQAAKCHMLEAVTAYALESAGIKDPAFTEAKNKAIRKNIIMDTDRAMIQQKMDAAGIWYMPLKGIVLKEMYPAIGMRQMSDNDILFDPSYAWDVKAIMEEQGFQVINYGAGIHDTYYRKPVSNFEMHRMLFGEIHDESLVKYYSNVKSRLLKDEDNACGYHFSAEDFYIYITAHEYRHYTCRGTGLRSLLDTWVYCTQKSDKMNWSYITEECEKLSIEAFERENRSLSLKLFNGEKLTEEDLSMLDYILSSGIYGINSHKVNNELRKSGGGSLGKIRYISHRIFMPMNNVRTYYPAFAKHPVLLPFLPAYRFFKHHNFKKLKTELKMLIDYKEQKPETDTKA